LPLTCCGKLFIQTEKFAKDRIPYVILIWYHENENHLNIKI
jgi:hypothetical protein